MSEKQEMLLGVLAAVVFFAVCLLLLAWVGGPLPGVEGCREPRC